MKLYVVLAAVCAAVAVFASNAGATTTSVCTLKMAGYPVWLRIAGAGAGACDEIGMGAGGGAVRTYDGVHGAARCAFNAAPFTLTLYSTSSLWGPTGCTLVAKYARQNGWARIF